MFTVKYTPGNKYKLIQYEQSRITTCSCILFGL